jgi:NTP pyrophosphatase (non-canonical NTP hydrolase)
MLARLTEVESSRALRTTAGRTEGGEDAGDVGEEIADAMFELVCLANSLNVDLDESLGR